MSSLIKVSMLSMAAIVTLQAAQIQIGGASGLTSNYMNSITSCSGASDALTTAQAGSNGCASITQAGTTVQRNYVAHLFQNATGAVAPAGTTLTDAANGNVTFNRIQGDTNTVSTTTTSSDYWTTGSTWGSSVVVPVGVYGVDKVWTMLNDYWGGNGQVGNIAVTFRWDDSSNGSGGVSAAYNQTFNLTNGETVRSAVNCASNVANCQTAGGSMPISTSLDSLVAHSGVTANNIYTDSTGNSTGTVVGVGSKYKSQTGLTLRLDDQLFSFSGLHSNEFLVSITISGQLTAGYGAAGTNTDNSRLALSAVTVEQVPEPGTIFMALAGLGALGYFRRRKA